MRGAQIEQPPPFWVDHDNGAGHVQHQHAAGHRVDDLLQRRAHPIVFSQAPRQRSIALRELNAKMPHLMLQVAIRGLQLRRRGDELREGVSQQPRIAHGVESYIIYWSRMRTGQHLPSSFARGVPNWTGYAQTGTP